MPDEPFDATAGESWETRMVRDWLRKPFKPEQIGKLPATAKRPALSYVGHAAVTDRLNKIAPDWSYTIDNMSTIGDTIWIRGTMTIGGVSRPEFGDGDDPKEAIGNFIRRGAMRFGVAIDLWSREELEVPGGSPAYEGLQPAGSRGTSRSIPSPAAGPAVTPRAGAASKPSTVLAPAEGAGDISVGIGEVPATAPGEAVKPPLASPCTHRAASGRWLPTKQKDGVPVCPRCGMSALLFKESA